MLKRFIQGGGKAKPCLTLSLGQDLESRVQTCNEALWQRCISATDEQ